MFPIRHAMQKTCYPPLRPFSNYSPFPTLLPRLLCTTTEQKPRPVRKEVPSESSIVCDLRRGDYERGVRRFCKRPRSLRSNELHETLILAVAQVPDAVVAEAILRAMPRPTLMAVASVVNALCRECNVPAAVDVLERSHQWDLPLDSRILAAVTRAAQRAPKAERDTELARLSEMARSRRLSKSSATPMYTATAAEFFVEGGGDGEAWLKAMREGGFLKRETQSRRSLKKVMNAEASLRAARGDVRQVMDLWRKIQGNPQLRGEVGVLAAAVSALVSSGWYGRSTALDLLMTWVHEHLYDSATGLGKTFYTENASAMALLITSASKVLAAAARPAPQMALSAVDALWRMDLPGFSRSLPIAGSYFKVLQHAALSLEETRDRIENVKEHHIQLDEQGFSMALGAILRCNERVMDKLEAGKAWVARMRQAGIPLTVQTYNLFAGQMRYCNDPEMVGSLLSDMTTAGVVPTPVTYGLVFSACVIPGEYTSPSRKSALSVSMWKSVLEAMNDHMAASGVVHTANSRLSLARAYAHLGLVGPAMEQFENFLLQRGDGDGRSVSSRREVEDAYFQMMFNFAHCREASNDGPEMVMTLFERMKQEGVEVPRHAIDCVLVSCVRKGDSERALQYAVDAITEDSHHKLSLSGLKHLLMAHLEMCNPEYWEHTRSFVLNSSDLLSAPQLAHVVEKTVVAFARRKFMDVCEDLMQMANVEMRDLEYVVHGREFTRFRGGKSQEMQVESDDAASPGRLSRKDILEGAQSNNSNRKHLSRVGEGSILPLM